MTDREIDLSSRQRENELGNDRMRLRSCVQELQG